MSDLFATYEYLLTSSLCVLALLGMGTSLTVAAFRDVAARPRTLLLIAFVQLVVGPLLAIGLSRVSEQPTGIALGMVLVTALPGGLFSNVFALLARAHLALSVSATAVCTLGSLVMTTLVLRVFGPSQLPAQIQMPVGSIVFEIVACLLLPLSAGMLLRRYLPRQAPLIGRLCVRAATAMLVVYVFAAFQSGRIDLSAFGWTTHLVIIVLAVLQVLACFVLAWPFRVTSLESFTCQLEVVVRNIHLGLLLKASLFPASESSDLSSQVMFVLLYYGGTSIVTGLVMVLIRRIELRVMGDRHRAPPPPDLQGW